MRRPPNGRSARPPAGSSASKDIALGNGDTWEDSPDRHPPQGLVPIGPVAYRIVQRLGLHLRVVEGGRL